MIATEVLVDQHKLKLAHVRAELFLRQKDLAVLAGVHFNVVKSCEKGNPIRLLSAYRLLKALNIKRAEAGMSRLALIDLDWKIYGIEPGELQGK